MKRIHVAVLGFTLVEMAMVLLIVALLLGGGLSVFSAQIEQQKFKDTQKVLEDAKEALIGFAAANGRLPCPAAPALPGAGNGVESYAGVVGASACTNPYNGFLPAATLGLPGVDANGYSLDGWAGRVRYAVTTASANAATNSNGIRNVPAVLPATPMEVFGAAANLRVCGVSTGITAFACGAPPPQALTTTAVAVIFSVGANAGAGVGADEAANQNADQVFVFHEPYAFTAPTNEFDDIFTWIPPAILFNRMIQAGKLP